MHYFLPKKIKRRGKDESLSDNFRNFAAKITVLVYGHRFSVRQIFQGNKQRLN